MSDSPEPTSLSRGTVVTAFTVVVGAFLSLILYRLGLFSMPAMLVCLLAGAGAGWLVDAVMVRGAAGLVGNIFAAGNIEPAPSYPIGETLMVRGKFAEAAEHLRAHLEAHPEDYEVRLRLAEIDVAQLRGYEEAERLYKDVRDAREDKRRELAAFNGLIEMYTKMDRKDRLKVELARFADRYAGSQQALEARRRLDELKSGV